jgi:CRISPR/Cas system-associated exonuclease Cas4 (RecB family)
MRMDIDITWGDAMACEFYVESPSKVGVIQYTSFRSKTDPSNTIFALDDKSLKSFIDFLNRFDGFKLDVGQFEFLDRRDDYQPK